MRIALALAVGSVLLAGCNQHIHGAPYIGVEIENQYAEPTLLFQFFNPWYSFPYPTQFSASDFNCDKATDNSWWFRVYVETPDGRAVGTGNWTNMDCPAQYTLTVLPSGELELSLQKHERGRHPEPEPIPA